MCIDTVSRYGDILLHLYIHVYGLCMYYSVMVIVPIGGGSCSQVGG